VTDAVQYLATIPSPTQSVWHLWFLPIRAYAVFIIIGIVAACWILEIRLRQRGAPKWVVLDIALWAVPFGLVGGRLYHLITSPDAYFGPGGHPLQAFAVWEGGLGIWGAVALGGVGAWIGGRRMGIPLTTIADALAPGLPVAQAIGRLGNYFNNELYGAHTNLPWGLNVYQWDLTAGRPFTDVFGQPLLVPGGPFHPTFLYELIWDLGVAALVYFVDRRYVLGKGRAFALYVAGYTVGRFWIEALRIDDAHHFLGLRLNDWVSILVFAGAVAYLVRVKGAQEHMRVAEDGTVTIVDPSGNPIPYYKPFTPPPRDGGEGGSTGTDPQWWLTTKRRSAEIWSSVTSRWAGDGDDHDDGDERDGRSGQPAGTARDKK
jgi:prolipoprotein diacylglyceryl transferase